ncbi:MAG: DUF2252 family protein [Janthinobacterium lividum]
MMPLPKAGQRLEILANIRNVKMARSSHAYVRGSTAQFYSWLDSVEPASMPEGPAIWICGDCHTGNLGPVANAKGKVEIQIRDFDQTVIGNPAHDLIRLGLSMATALRSSALPGVTTAKMLERLSDGYADAFEAKPENMDKVERPSDIHFTMKEALRRSWRHLAKERVAGGAVTFPLGKRFWPLSAAERRAVKNMFETSELHHLATMLRKRDNDAKVRLLDSAYWMKGCSSLGLLRIAALLDVDRSASKGSDMCLIDIKEGVKAAAPRNRSAVMPRDNAERIVTGARALSPHLGERMVAMELLERSVFVRELLPQDLKLEIEQVSENESSSVAYYLAKVVGEAHARQMDDATRRQWRSELKKNRSKSLDTPTWLWKSVVDLMAEHERGYLEHCRRYSLSQASATTAARR